MITYLDNMVGQVVKRLEAHGLDKNTVIFFTSDNGPHSEAGNDVNFFDANGPVSGIKRALFDGGIRVPMIVQWPGHVKAGITTPLMAGAVDFMATAAEIAGLKLDPPPTASASSPPSSATMSSRKSTTTSIGNSMSKAPSRLCVPANGKRSVGR